MLIVGLLDVWFYVFWSFRICVFWEFLIFSFLNFGIVGYLPGKNSVSEVRRWSRRGVSRQHELSTVVRAYRVMAEGAGVLGCGVAGLG